MTETRENPARPEGEIGEVGGQAVLGRQTK